MSNISFDRDINEVNRSAIVATPKLPFLEWLHSVDPTSSDLTLDDLTLEPDVYLVPECESEEEIEACLQRVFPVIFEHQLEGWRTDRSSWPAHRTLATFETWFNYEFHSLVLDLCDEPALWHV